ncbi:MAG TPA: substrate-binding domain-containing protein [Methylomirabilota bacterium]|nr:substrate-binding domain-containing protein [Methylomirabilota bacterium]
MKQVVKAMQWALVLLGLAGVTTADAAEIKVLSAGAVRAIITDLAQAFEQQTGNKVTLAFGTVGVTRKRLAEEAADVVIMTDVAIDEASAQGAVVAGSRADIARTGMGVGIREGAPKPDISTPEAFKQALLAAKSITYVDPAQGATSGIHFAGVLKSLGIAEAMQPRTTLVPGGYPAELVAEGKVEMVVHQISEIVPVKGVTLVGPLPKAVQKITTYSVGVAKKAEAPEVARAFVAFLISPATKAKLAAAGLDYKE